MVEMQGKVIVGNFFGTVNLQIGSRVGDRGLEIAGWRPRVGDRRLEIAGWRPRVGDRRLEIAGWRSRVGDRKLGA
ncbi:hypothetical protein ACOMHN_006126 [Nucella lapillus]